MQKTGMKPSQIAIMATFALSCFGLLLFLWLAFGGPIPLKPKGYRFKTSFGEATQLAKEADVRISGVSVGKVKTIATQNDGRSEAVIELKQAAGRLIRSSSDVGCLVIADARVLTKAYGREFLNAMPVDDIERVPTAEIANRIAQRFGR